MLNLQPLLAFLALGASLTLAGPVAERQSNVVTRYNQFCPGCNLETTKETHGVYNDLKLCQDGLVGSLVDPYKAPNPRGAYAVFTHGPDFYMGGPQGTTMVLNGTITLYGIDTMGPNAYNIFDDALDCNDVGSKSLLTCSQCYDLH